MTHVVEPGAAIDRGKNLNELIHRGTMKDGRHADFRVKKMTAKTFIVSDMRELMVMQRVFREAKFCTVPDDDEISDSDIVAALFSRLMNALIEVEVEVMGESARADWQAWLTMDDPMRSEWSAVRLRAQRKKTWPVMSDMERNEYVRLLFAPFIMSQKEIDQFVGEVNGE
ncbi:hypothetical protein [Pseudomonas turukhanskensis]|uniref:Uncharacterized protein n=1 Tax=Pseudomonas turukhanskensis TaxID=1806536 RepID=A0A9W6NFJ5_9PSED|nr:hypothetical protein [Pseudomonas turukhanskensis]GLK89769.1 hypothetical protein GCM10017655_28310 [Pseudomonas turukhanskensis]